MMVLQTIGFCAKIFCSKCGEGAKHKSFLLGSLTSFESAATKNWLKNTKTTLAVILAQLYSLTLLLVKVRDDVEPHENFMRGWEDYKVGFGDFDREFWLGNILIWALTNQDNSTLYELSIDLEDWSGNRRFARYRSFRYSSSFCK
jgi:hypothetical protein